MLHLCGWRRNDEEVSRHLSRLKRPTFAQAAPHLVNYYQGEDVLLSRSCKKVNNGSNLPADKQTIGDCVSHGNARAVDYLWCVKQAAGLASGYQEGQTSCMSEALYGEAREIGNDLSLSDGAVGIWAIQALQQYGFVGRKGVPYDGNKAKQWGYKGTPSDVKSGGKEHILEQYAQLNSIQDAANALKAGSSIAVCTELGFSMNRDSNGICRQQGRWGHCMACIGCCTISSDLYFLLLQSWGQMTPDGPVPFGGDAPDNSFLIDSGSMSHILGEGDSYAMTSIKGFIPIPPLDYVM